MFALLKFKKNKTLALTWIFLALIFTFTLTMPLYALENNNPLFEIYVPVSVGEKAYIIFDGTRFDAGEVIDIPTTSRFPSYTASAWGTPSTVCASAVNAVHLLVSVKDDKGRTISLVPKETIAPAAGVNASFVLLSPAAYGVFGAWAPPVGSPVFIKKSGTDIRTPLAFDNLPKSGDTLIISVIDNKIPYMAEIENRPGGRVTVWDSNGFSVVGRVIRPVGGTGRFEGTLFTEIGALRANHSGVIDFSTSKKGSVGGFQIIPWDHALSSKEMQGAWDMTQWLIIAPADGRSQMGGTYPLFKNAMVPGALPGEHLWDMWSTYGRNTIMVVRQNGGAWEKLKDASGKNDSALKDITHIRIYFPFVKEPQKDVTADIK